jgi:hypothetical protein
VAATRYFDVQELPSIGCTRRRVTTARVTTCVTPRNQRAFRRILCPGVVHGRRHRPRYPRPVSAERDELRRLIEELPDERVPAVLAELAVKNVDPHRSSGRRRGSAPSPAVAATSVATTTTCSPTASDAPE